MSELCLHCHKDLAEHHHRNLRCPTKREIYYKRDDSVMWNPYNKVVQSHRDGSIDYIETNHERKKRKLPIPWTPALGEKEVKEPPAP
jgi:hypothetical protein